MLCYVNCSFLNMVSIVSIQVKHLMTKDTRAVMMHLGARGKVHHPSKNHCPFSLKVTLNEILHLLSEMLLILCCSYGLLGPSGCGKTTLLKCIVGTLKISRGQITVLGKPPSFPGHNVPGKKVGYMPQVSKCVNILFALYSKLNQCASYI